MKKKIIILGSTGSIGKSLVNILKKDKKNIEVFLLSTNTNINELIKQSKIFNVKNLIVTDYNKYLILKKKIRNKKIKIYDSFSLVHKILNRHKVYYTMNAISGIDGLKPTLKIIRFSKKIAIANKESIICGWNLIKKELKKHKTDFIPVDSEHFSIWSLINKNTNKNIEKVFITASGGPFNNYPLKKFQTINPKKALNHPNWRMGKKISIDSATMMNKVFEVIEAKKIFDLEYNKIKILVHPKSYIHAIVKFSNGLSKILVHDTNMTIPIFNSYYEDGENKIKSKNLNISILNNLELKNVDLKKFPVVNILKSLPNKNSLFETVLVAANDKLVYLFLKNKIKFTDISRILLKIINSNEFRKYKQIRPESITQIERLNKYVSLKVETLSI